MHNRKHQLLIAAALLAVSGVLLDARAMAEIFRLVNLMAFAIEVLATKMFAMGLRSIAQSVLPPSRGNWYERPGSLVFLFLTLPCLAAIYCTIDPYSLRAEDDTWHWSELGPALVMTAMTLLWIVIDGGGDVATRSHGNQGFLNSCRKKDSKRVRD